jgi:hypothetical protein
LIGADCAIAGAGKRLNATAVAAAVPPNNARRVIFREARLRES